MVTRLWRPGWTRGRGWTDPERPGTCAKENARCFVRFPFSFTGLARPPGMPGVVAPAARALPWPLVPAAGRPLTLKRKRSDVLADADSAEPPTLVLSSLLRSIFNAELNSQLKLCSISGCVCIGCKASFESVDHTSDLCDQCAENGELVAELAKQGRVVCPPEVMRTMEMVGRPRRGVKLLPQFAFLRTLEPTKVRCCAAWAFHEA